MSETPLVTVESPVAARRFWPGVLREPGLRRFVTSTLVWGSAHQMLTLSQGFLVFDLTQSEAYLALLGAAVGLPALLLAAAGGFLADRLPQQRILLAGSLIAGIPMAAIAALHATGTLEAWHVLAAGLAQGTSLGLDWTSRLSLLPRMVSRPRLVQAVSVDLAGFQAVRVIAPLASGALLDTAGTPAVYALIAGLFAVNVLVVASFRPAARGARTPAPVAQDAREVLALLRRDGVLGMNVLFTGVNALMLGGFVYLAPAFVSQQLGGGSGSLGVVLTLVGVGAFTGSSLVALRGGVRNAGAGLVVSNLLFAGSAAAYAFTGSLWSAAPVAVLFGTFNAVHMSLGAAAIQTAVPDEVRGRVFGAYEVAWSAFPLGGLFFGLLASAAGLSWAYVAGAAMVSAFTVAAWALSSGIRGLRL